MKRYLSLALIVLMLPALLAVPARADEISDSGKYDLLDYTTANNSGSNVVVISPGEEVSYELISNSTVYGVDVLLRFSNGVVPSASYVTIGNRTYELNMINYGDYYYRLYCDTAKSSSSLKFSFDSTSELQLSFYSIEVCFFNTIYSVLPAQMTGLVLDGQEFNLNYDGSLVYTSWSGGNAIADYRRFSSDLIVRGNVHAYDYIDVDLTLSVSGVQSISVDDGLNALPYEINEIYQPSDSVGTMPNVLVSLRIDVRSLEEGYYPNIRITGDSSTGFNVYQINYVGGILAVDPPSSLVYWFSHMNLWLQNQTNALISAVNSNFKQLGTWLSDQTDSIGQFFVTLINRVGVFFTTQTDAISSSISSWGQSLKSSIDALPDKIAEALQALFVPSDSAVQNMGQQSEELAQDRFGGAYEGALIIDEFASNLKPQQATQILTVPVVNLDILGVPFPLGGWEVDLVPDGTEIVVETCKIVIDILATLAFINGLRNRLERTLER